MFGVSILPLLASTTSAKIYSFSFFFMVLSYFLVSSSLVELTYLSVLVQTIDNRSQGCGLDFSQTTFFFLAYGLRHIASFPAIEVASPPSPAFPGPQPCLLFLRGLRSPPLPLGSMFGTQIPRDHSCINFSLWLWTLVISFSFFCSWLFCKSFFLGDGSWRLYLL